jgi:hypothetical protein
MPSPPHVFIGVSGRILVLVELFGEKSREEILTGTGANFLDDSIHGRNPS